MSRRIEDQGMKIAKLITDRDEYKQKLKVLPTLLEDKKLTIEEFKILKEDYKEKIEETEKEIEKLCGIKTGLVPTPPVTQIPPRQVEYIPPRQAEYIPPKRQEQEQHPTIKIEQKQSDGLGNCAGVCLIIFIIGLIILFVTGWSITSLFGW